MSIKLKLPVEFLKFCLGISLFLITLTTLGQKPQLSFFTELPAGDLEKLFSNPRVISDLKLLKAEIRMGILDFSQERVQVIRKLQNEGIPVVAWLLLPKDQGYWFNMENGAEAIIRYKNFKKWSKSNDIRWSRVGLDLEPNIEDIVLMTSKPNAALKKAIFRLFETKRLEKGKLEYQYLLDAIKRDGYEVETYILPFLLDERKANSQAFQKITGILDIPNDNEIPMLYSSFFGENGIVFIPVYGKGLNSVAIGSTGGGVKIEGMTKTPPTLSWDDLQRDIKLAGQVSKKVHIFCLESCVEKGYLSKINKIDFNEPSPDISSKISNLSKTRSKIQIIFTLLNFPVLLLFFMVILIVTIIFLIIWVTKKLYNRLRILKIR